MDYWSRGKFRHPVTHKTFKQKSISVAAPALFNEFFLDNWWAPCYKSLSSWLRRSLSLIWFFMHSRCFVLLHPTSHTRFTHASTHPHSWFHWWTHLIALLSLCYVRRQMIWFHYSILASNQRHPLFLAGLLSRVVTIGMIKSQDECT